MQISRKRFEIETWNKLPTNKKWPTAERMVTSSMTSRDDVIDDVTWPLKCKVVIPISLRRIISKTAVDRDSVTRGHPYKMASSVSNGHVTDDPERLTSWVVNFRCKYLENGLRYRLGNNYSQIGNGLSRQEWWHHRWRHVTLKGQGRDPNIFYGRLFRKRLEIETCSKLGSGHL